MTLTIKLDRNWSSFQLANSAPPLSVTDSAIAPSARIHKHRTEFVQQRMANIPSECLHIGEITIQTAMCSHQSSNLQHELE